MNRLLVANMHSNNYVWRKDEPFNPRKIRSDEIDIYFVNDEQYLVENIIYIDKETNKGQIIGQPEIKQINTFDKAIEIIQFMQRRMSGEKEYCINNYSQGYIENVCYSVKYNDQRHFSEKMFLSGYN